LTAVHLVLKQARAETRTFPPEYSPAVQRALHAIQQTRQTHEAKLSEEDQLDLASGLHLLAVAALLQAQVQVAAIGADGESRGEGRQHDD
jgi:hypothetical protein